LDITREDAVIPMAAAGMLKTAHHPKYEYEIKFAVPLAQAHEFLVATSGRLVPQVYDESLPIAFSRTTYLDTPDRRYLVSSEELVSRRLRIREYAGAPAAGTPVRLMNLCYLEYKESRAGQRRKARVRIAAQDAAGILANPLRLLDGSQHLGLAEQEAAQMLVGELEGSPLSTQLTTWYRRQSLRDTSGRVRVTLDTEIAFCHPLALDSWQRDEPALPPDRVAGHAPSCLLEVKCQGASPAWLRRAMSSLGEPPEKRLSKYAMGMRMLLQAAAQPPKR
jgi:hypothetical protein